MAIPNDIKKQFDIDPFYKKCCLCCATPVEMHHNLIYGGRQVNLLWAILPVCHACHMLADRKDFRSRLNAIMRERSNGELSKFEKFKKFV